MVHQGLLAPQSLKHSVMAHSLFHSTILEQQTQFEVSSCRSDLVLILSVTITRLKTDNVFFLLFVLTAPGV